MQIVLFFKHLPGTKLLMKEISNNKDKTYDRHIQNKQQMWDESLRIEKRGGMR